MSSPSSIQAAAAPVDMAWEIVPHGWFSRHYDLKRGGEVVTTLRMALFREQCDFEIAGHTFAIRRVSIWQDRFQLVIGGDGESVCDVKRSFWSRKFEIVAADERWVLQPISFFSWGHRLLAGKREMGTIRPAGWFTRRRVATFVGEVPPPVQVLAIFLVLVVSQRQSETSGG